MRLCLDFQHSFCLCLCCRGLFVLEYAWHVAFKPWETHCRLSYDCIQNRAFYTTLFRHMQLIGRAGASFAVCMLLLVFSR